MSAAYSKLGFLPTAEIDPLLEERARQAGGLVRVLGRNLASSWHRARRAGAASPELVDRVCVEGLNRHPAEIYGARWSLFTGSWR